MCVCHMFKIMFRPKLPLADVAGAAEVREPWPRRSGKKRHARPGQPTVAVDVAMNIWRMGMG